MGNNKSKKDQWSSDSYLKAVRSFISDVKVKDNISKEEMSRAVALKTKPVIAEKEIPKQVDYSVPLEKDSVPSSIESLEYSYSQAVSSNKKKIKKEKLVDIVEDLDSCVKARRGLGVEAIARVHCLYDGNGETFWFTNRLVNMYDFPELRVFGRFVPKYSDVAIQMQKGEVGTSFDYLSPDYLNRLQTHRVLLENQSDLQNQTIAIAGDSLKYQYRSIKDFLDTLRQNTEEIRDVESQIIELEEQRKEEDNPHKRGQITNTIKKLQEQYRILTQQQEDLKNITIYIRKQGEMRYSLIVDPIQTRIMSQNLFDGKSVVIKGGPGTGKTTTMIHRLAYLTDTYAIDEDERKHLNKYKITPLQRKKLREAIKAQRDWMFFSPSQMLKEYLADAMRKEGLENTSKKVWNWKDYCRMVLQEYYHLLEKNGENAPFKVCHNKATLFYHNSNIINIFTCFYLDQLRGIKAKLPQLNSGGTIYAWTAIAQNIQKRFEEVDNYDLAHFVSLFNTLENVYGNDCKNLLLKRNNALKELADKICAMLDDNKDAKEDIEAILDLVSDELLEKGMEDEEIDADEEIDEAGNIISKTQKMVKPLFGNKPKESELAGEIQSWLKSYCYSKVSGQKDLSDEQQLISDCILPVIENKFDDEIKKMGEMMVFEQFAQYTRGIRSIMLNGIPARYKKFRTHLNKTKFEGCDQNLLRELIQSKQGKELHHQEQSLLLGFINTLVKQIKASTNAKIRHDYIEAYEELARPIIGIDEATDFSICDIYAMQSLLTSEYNSLTLCGDMMQRMTSYGIDSWNEMDGVVANPAPVEMKMSYRQSKKLLEVASKLCEDTLGETPSYRAFMKSNKVPAPLVYVDESELSKIDWISKRVSEVYRAYGDRLPSIAIFVTEKGYIPRFINNLQDTDFFMEKRIKILDGTKVNNIPENHICVYPIEVVKGMEFDVVFFHNIDKSDADIELMKRYIYVGVSRAAFFLGVTMNEEIHEISGYFEKNKDWFKI